MDRSSDEAKSYGSKSHFFWDGRIHKRLAVSRPENLLYAWDYENKRRVAIVYSDWKRNKGVALTNNEVCDLINRDKSQLFRWMQKGFVRKPVSVGKGERKNDITNKHKYYWSEKDLMDIQEFMCSRIGKQRVNPDTIPSKEELRAKLNEDELVTYIKDSEGNFIPTWKA